MSNFSIMFCLLVVLLGGNLLSWFACLMPRSRNLVFGLRNQVSGSCCKNSGSHVATALDSDKDSNQINLFATTNTILNVLKTRGHQCKEDKTHKTINVES